jgi:hypothetical protein
LDLCAQNVTRRSFYRGDVSIIAHKLDILFTAGTNVSNIAADWSYIKLSHSRGEFEDPSMRVPKSAQRAVAGSL